MNQTRKEFLEQVAKGIDELSDLVVNLLDKEVKVKIAEICEAMAKKLRK